MTTSGYALFDTAFGPCGIAWTGQGVSRLQLPERTAGDTEDRIRRTSGAAKAAPPASARKVADSLRRYFTGEPMDFGAMALDLSTVSAFLRSVYQAARAIPWGRTATYGDLAKQVGSPGGARAIGRAMATNPVPIIIPCHRVLASDGKLGGFSAFGGTVQKERLLILERIRLPL